MTSLEESSPNHNASGGGDDSQFAASMTGNGASSSVTAAVLPASTNTGAVLRFQNALGSRVSMGKLVDHLDDNTISYVSGKHFSMVTMDTPLQQRFLLKGAKTTSIVTFCISPNKKYIALSEKVSGGSCQVVIYTQQTGSKVRTLDFKYLTKLPVTCMCFSTDNKYLVTVTPLPDVYIYLWQVDKSRLIGMTDVPCEIGRVTISPWAYHTLCTTGPVNLKIWRLQDKQLKPMDVLMRRKDVAVVHGAEGEAHPPSGSSVAMASGGTVDLNQLFSSMHFSSHAWFDDELVVAVCAEGHMLIVDHGETKRVFLHVHGEGFGLFAVQALARGIVVGGEGGVFSFFERIADQEYFSHLRRINLASLTRVIDISVAPREDAAVCLHRNNAVTSISLDLIESLRTPEEQVSSLIPVSFHEEDVSCVDVAVQKSFIVTGSIDRYVRVYNFAKRKVEFTKRLDEEILSLAVHPMGLRLLIGTKSSLRLFNLLVDDLHLCAEFPVKGCTELRFSHGGAFFAAAVQQRVYVFNAYDFQSLFSISSHVVPVKSLWWGSNDQYLYIADINGVAARYRVDPLSQPREEIDEVPRKNIAFSCIRYDDTTRCSACIGVVKATDVASGLYENEVVLRCSRQGDEPQTIKLGVNAVTHPNTTRRLHTSELVICSAAKTLIVGTPTGCLYLYEWPIVVSNPPPKPYHIVEVHTGEIHHILLSKDEKQLFSMGADRCMFVFDVDQVINGKTLSKRPFNYAAFDDVCYVLQSVLDDKQREIQDAYRQLDEVIQAKQQQEDLLTRRFESAKSALENEAKSHIDALTRQLEQARKEKRDADRALSEQAQQLDKAHLTAAEELEALYARRTEEANQRFQAIKAERDDLVVRYENKLFKLQGDHETERRRLDETAASTEARLKHEITSMQTAHSEAHRVSEGALEQTIADYELMLDEMQERNRRELQRAEEELARAINASTTGERDAERLRREKQGLVQELHERDHRIDKMDSAADVQRRENESLRKEMYVRFESMSAAEKKIQHLKKQTTELEKLRYVLTFKFNELKKEVAPKEKQLELLNSRVEEIDSELSRMSSERDSLRQSVEKKEHKIGVMSKELASQVRMIDDQERVLDSLLRELTSLVAFEDQKRLVFQLKDVVDKYTSRSEKLSKRTSTALAGNINTTNALQDTAIGLATAGPVATQEFDRQRTYMESQLGCITRQSKQREGILRMESLRGTAENTLLVREINELRHERKALATKCNALEVQLRDARMSLQRATLDNNSININKDNATSSAGGVSTTPSPPAAAAAAASSSFAATPGLTRAATADVTATAAGSPAANFAPSRRSAGGSIPLGRRVIGPTKSAATAHELERMDAGRVRSVIEQVHSSADAMEKQRAEMEQLRSYVEQLLVSASGTPAGAAVAGEIRSRMASQNSKK